MATCARTAAIVACLLCGCAAGKVADQRRAAPAPAADADIARGDAAFQRQAYEIANAAYQAAFERRGFDLPTASLVRWSQTHMALGSPEDAVLLLDGALAHRPDDPALLHARATARWSLGDRAGAVEDAEAFFRLGGQSCSLLRMRGRWYGDAPLRAAWAYERYLTCSTEPKRPEDVTDARLRLGHAYLRLQKLDDAAAQFAVVADEASPTTVAWFNAVNGLCAAEAGAGRFRSAVEHCTELTRRERHPSWQKSALVNLSLAYIALGHYDRADATVQHLLELDPNIQRGQALRLIGDAYLAQGRCADAERAYRRGGTALHAARVDALRTCGP